MLFTFVTASTAQAIIEPVSLAVIGFTALVAFIVGDKAIEHSNNSSVAKQVAAEQKTEGKLQAASETME
jgi:hypothetical protein